MKKFLEYIKSSKSDFILFLILILLLNLVGGKAFFRWDLTSPRSYSLSQSSKQVVKTLEEPLSIKVFFTDSLPSPYNSVEQYLKDLMVEYKSAANKNFSYEFYDMDKPENVNLANEYRISQKQVQEVKDNEVGIKNVYMGIAVLYADSIEILDEVTSSDGLEYTLTGTIEKMINNTSAVAGLQGKVNLTLYYSKQLNSFNINGLSKLEQAVASACASVNKKNLDKLIYQSIDPSQEEIDSICAKYGIEYIPYEFKDSKSETNTGKGMIAAILEYKDTFKVLPIHLARGFFGNYGITGLDDLDKSLSESLQSLVQKTTEIGYLTGFGTKVLSDEREGSARFSMLIQDRYSFKELDLVKEEIPLNINHIVVNGPTEKISENVLYKLDQFIVKGGRLTVFTDSFKEIPPQNQYSLPTYEPIENGMIDFLAKYGINVEKNYVLDSKCYEANQRGMGKVPLYYVPILLRKSLNQKNPITKNLSYVLFYQNSSINIDEQVNPNLKQTVLVKSSPKSWTMSENIILHPMYLTKPEESSMSSQNLVVLVEGKFSSQFEKNPMVEESKTGGITGGFSNHLSNAVQKGKILVVGSSALTTSTIIDEEGSQPVALFVRNIIDFMSDNDDLCTMRTKGLGLNTLNVTSSTSVKIAKIVNQYCVPLLVVVCGLIIYRLRKKRRQAIRAEYGSTDERESLSLDKKENRS